MFLMLDFITLDDRIMVGMMCIRWSEMNGVIIQVSKSKNKQVRWYIRYHLTMDKMDRYR